MKLQELIAEVEYERSLRGTVCCAVAGGVEYLIQILDICTPPLTCNWEIRVALFGGSLSGEERVTLEFRHELWTQLPPGEEAFWWESTSIPALDGKPFDLEVLP